ncbi:MAG: hypothetical protein AAFP19_13785 [Bacteroidota bacterium]
MTTISKQHFLVEEVPVLLNQLEADRIPQFGLMTPQHMVEHLVYTTKSSVKDYCPPPAELNKRQTGFRKFIENGAIFQHRPSNKTKADLPQLKYTSLEEAIEFIPQAIERFYSHFKDDPTRICFHPFMGQLDFEGLELFHFQHFRYHLWQFKLLDRFP